LLLNGSNWLSEENEAVINLGNTIITGADNKSEAGTGYFKKMITAEKIEPAMGNISVKVNSSNQKNQPSVWWGAAYWQYFEDINKVTAATTPLRLNKQLFREINTDKGPALKPITENASLKVGDKIKVRIELKVDRDMEYVHMKDMRAACMEPANVLSEYKYQGRIRVLRKHW
jgi:hypothetical protein